jgi:hypothetical protein
MLFVLTKLTFVLGPQVVLIQVEIVVIYFDRLGLGLMRFRLKIVKNAVSMKLVTMPTALIENTSIWKI